MTDYREQLQAEVNELRSRVVVGKHAEKKKIVVVSPSQQRAEVLFNARQAVESAERTKVQVETEYRVLKERIQKINSGLVRMEKEVMELRKTAKQALSDMRSGAWLSTKSQLKHLEDRVRNPPYTDIGLKSALDLLPPINDLLRTESKVRVQFPHNLPLQNDVRVYDICGDNKNVGQQLKTSLIRQYMRGSSNEYNALCTLFDKTSTEITHLNLIISLDEESIDELTTRLAELISPLDVARTTWLALKQELAELEQGQPGVEGSD